MARQDGRARQESGEAFDSIYSTINKKLGARTKQPYAFALADGQPLAFAGIWEHWKQPGGALEIDSFSIITTEPNELTAI